MVNMAQFMTMAGIVPFLKRQSAMAFERRHSAQGDTLPFSFPDNILVIVL